MALPVASAEDRQLIQRTTRHLVDSYSPKGNRTGWLMIASIFIESWDLYSIAFILVFLQEQYHPSSFLLGLASAGTQAGAVVGALLGGWLSDRVGRRAVFIATMVTFIIVGAAQAFVPNMLVLAGLRFVLGVPLGMDISNGYTYIMESLPANKREVMGNRWQFMFAVGEVIAIAVVTVLLWSGIGHEYLWRIILGLSALPAIVLFVMRMKLPETVVWLVARGRFREAKHVAADTYGDPLDMLPDSDVDVPRPRLRSFLKAIRKDETRWRGSVFGWLSGLAQGGEFATFAFYLPILLVLLGVSGVKSGNLITLALYVLAAISGWVGPAILHRIGQRRLSLWGFSMVVVALIMAAIGIFTDTLVLVPIAAAIMLWGHYWDAENCMTISSMVAPPQYRGTASGFAYIFVKVPAFFSILVFPTLFDAIGKGAATLLVLIFPLIGIFAATFVLPKNIDGYRGDHEYADEHAAVGVSG